MGCEVVAPSLVFLVEAARWWGVSPAGVTGPGAELRAWADGPTWSSVPCALCVLGPLLVAGGVGVVAYV